MPPERFEQCAVVVLSACSTAAGASVDPDSLVRRFLAAGAAGVVASQWAVDSASTQSLMRTLYSRLLAGHPVSEALWAAKESIRNVILGLRVHLFPSAVLIGPDGKIVSLNQRDGELSLRGTDLLKTLDRLLPP